MVVVHADCALLFIKPCGADGFHSSEGTSHCTSLQGLHLWLEWLGLAGILRHRQLVSLLIKVTFYMEI